MSTLPNLNETIVRQRASDTVWGRGLRYYNNGSVDEVVWRDGWLTADVQGSGYEPYQVQVRFDGDRLISAECDCPYDHGGDCKHIIAALIYMSRKADEIDSRPTLDTLINGLDHGQLVALLRHLSTVQPQILSQIERWTLQSAAHKAKHTEAPIQVDTRLIIRQVKADVRGSIEHGYDGWGGDRFYDSDLGSALDPACDMAREQLRQNHPLAALTILEAAIQGWDLGIDSLDEYVQEAFEDMADEFLVDLAELCTEAVLTANLTRQELDHWADKFEEWSNEIYGGEALDMVATAAFAGWDEPALVSAMQGSITERGAWADEAPFYADQLAKIRLDILEKRGQLDEYLNFAQAEGQFMPYLHMLIKQGVSDKTISEAMAHLTQPSSIQALCITLAEQGEIAQALKLAQYGLRLEDTEGRHKLAAWLRDQAQAHNYSELAMMAARQALAEAVTLENYVAMQQNAGSTWEAIKPDILQMVAYGNSAENKVDIYLHEGMLKEAIETVNNAQWYSNINRVIDAVQDDYPEWVFQQCRKRADSIMDGGISKQYDVAADWLRRGRQALINTGKSAEWATYYDTITTKHARKYKLMPMLKALR